jgi:hypothetical protein
MNYFNLIVLLIACTNQSEAYTGNLIFSKIRESSNALYSSNERSNEPKKWQVGNKGTDMSKSKEDRGAAGDRDWKSGYVFNKNQPKKRRNDPWWMREEESNNPRQVYIHKHSYTHTVEFKYMNICIHRHSYIYVCKYLHINVLTQSFIHIYRVLPVYKPWWLTDNMIVDDSWKVADLKVEATRRGRYRFMYM